MLWLLRVRHQRRLPRYFANLQCRTVRDIHFQSTRWYGRWFIGIAPVASLGQKTSTKCRSCTFMYSTSRTRPESPGDLPTHTPRWMMRARRGARQRNFIQKIQMPSLHRPEVSFFLLRWPRRPGAIPRPDHHAEIFFVLLI